MTHTFAKLEVSEKTYKEIKEKLEAAGYHHAFVDGVIDMNGIGLAIPDYSDWVPPENTHTCPRRGESPFGRSEIEADMDSFHDHWRKPEDSCSCCGSLNPDVFMDRLEKGDISLGTTDKSYKVYVHNDGGEQFKQTYRDDKADKFYGYGHPAHNWITKDVEQTKFYFQHFSDKQMERFVELYNDKKIKFKGGFGFYVFPYFMAPVKYKE